jgi:oxygen-independent coproporphyrinogen-3 oxidase
MNRAHDAKMAFDALKNSTDFFTNISVDLIYGIPGSEIADLERALQHFIDYSIPHVSAYALTVEHKTALEKLIAKGAIPAPDETSLEEHFKLVRKTLRVAGYDHYEISNFGKPNFHSQHNSSYWSGAPYLGIGPSAHSYLGTTRMWNVSNNMLYVKALEAEKLPSTSEELSLYDRHNEFVMTQLRLENGISLARYETTFGERAKTVLLKQAKKYLAGNQLEMSDTFLRISEKGLFFADGIAADFFLDASDGILIE